MVKYCEIPAPASTQTPYITLSREIRKYLKLWTETIFSDNRGQPATTFPPPRGCWGSVYFLQFRSCYIFRQSIQLFLHFIHFNMFLFCSHLFQFFFVPYSDFILFSSNKRRFKKSVFWLSYDRLILNRRPWMFIFEAVRVCNNLDTSVRRSRAYAIPSVINCQTRWNF